MSWQESVRKSIQALAETAKLKDKPDVYYAEVDSVNEAARTCSCTLISGTSDISLTQVNLMAEVNDGLLRLPTVGSTVYILSTPGVTPWVDVFSELDKIFYVAGGGTFLIWKDGIELMGKKYGGIPEVEALVKQINAIENLLNDIISKYNSHTHILTLSSGTGTAATTLTQETGTISPVTKRADLENTKVQHGDGS